MHEETVRFLRETREMFPAEFSGCVLEFGSQCLHEQRQARDVTGPSMLHTGVDCHAGIGVDIVDLFHNPWEPPALAPYDAFVCVNTFEHDPYWHQSLAKAVRMTRYDGVMALSVPNETCAEHDVQSAPDGKHYGGIRFADLQAALDEYGMAGTLRSINREDNAFCGRNKSGVARCYDMALCPSDIHEHVPRLWWYASQCRSVREFGVRSGVSTSALVMGCADVQSYDIADPTADHLRVLRRWGWKFERKSSLEVEPSDVDMLFIDSNHEGEHLWLELVRHESRVRKWIVMHDTETFAVRGDGGGEGLMVAIRRLIDRGQWRQREHFTNNNGLTVLERVPA